MRSFSVTTIFPNQINNIHIQLKFPHAYYPRMELSEKRLAANRANAARSTGPTSAEGKRISSRNGARKSELAKFILIEGESGARFDALVLEYQTEFQPSTPTERDFIHAMATARWNQTRTTALHSAAINYEIRIRRESGVLDENEDACTRAMLAIRASGNAPHLELFSRDQSRFDRQYNHALRGLMRFQAEKRKIAENTRQPEENKGIDQ